MADRTSAEIFSTLFRILASENRTVADEIAKKIWPEMRRYDFHPCQMDCDDELISMGLAHRNEHNEVVYMTD